jgi:hypothetical protein
VEISSIEAIRLGLKPFFVVSSYSLDLLLEIILICGGILLRSKNMVYVWEFLVF